MIKLSVFYPFDAAARFDFDYYRDQHFPMVMQRLQAFGVKGFEVDRGLPDADGNPPRFLAVGHLLCSDGERLAAGLAEHGAEIMADVANYTDLKPFTQLNAAG
ncbi:EthD family reductase [Massilia agilis]|uniref:EthD family reductase n=2 Tax=Massilia TaxID=149698 RepID=A0ABT2BPM9_9BURK|nr:MULTISPECIES: EthD family reductase [Massilia]MCS0610478.1 EthD family reductase [Massilia solisilvae]MCS0810785.1 EthD family reductase [Massilia agilis]